MILLQAKDASLRFILNVENDNETDMVKKMLVSPVSPAASAKFVLAKVHMTPEQILETERLAVEWKSRHAMPQ